eukprot:scaffold20574_cov101-Isochrysis_galbana.AAC.1
MPGTIAVGEPDRLGTGLQDPLAQLRGLRHRLGLWHPSGAGPVASAHSAAVMPPDEPGARRWGQRAANLGSPSPACSDRLARPQALLSSRRPADVRPSARPSSFADDLSLLRVARRQHIRAQPGDAAVLLAGRPLPGRLGRRAQRQALRVGHADWLRRGGAKAKVDAQLPDLGAGVGFRAKSARGSLGRCEVEGG